MIASDAAGVIKKQGRRIFCVLENVEKSVGPRVEKILKNRLLFFSSRKASCTLKKIKHFKSRKTAQLCGFCVFCLNVMLYIALTCRMPLATSALVAARSGEKVRLLVGATMPFVLAQITAFFA